MTSFNMRKACVNDIISIVKMKLQMFEEAGIAMGINEDDFPFCLYPNPVYGFIDADMMVKYV